MTKEEYITQYIEQIFPIRCLGRDAERKTVLEKAVGVSVNIHKAPNSSMISSSVECEYNCGAHGEMCRAAKKGEVICPYSFDIPYALDSKLTKKILEKE